jgi:hypothetical protein
MISFALCANAEFSEYSVFQQNKALDRLRHNLSTLVCEDKENAEVLLSIFDNGSEPNIDKLLIIAKSETDYTEIKTLAIMQYLKVQDYNDEVIKGFLSEKTESFDHQAGMLMLISQKPSAAGFEMVKKLLEEIDISERNEMGSIEIARICSEYFFDDNQYGKDLFKIINDKEWSVYFRAALWRYLFLHCECLKQEPVGVMEIIRKCLLEEFDPQQLRVIRSTLSSEKYEKLWKCKEEQLSGCFAAIKGVSPEWH